MLLQLVTNAVAISLKRIVRVGVGALAFVFTETVIIEFIGTVLLFIGTVLFIEPVVFLLLNQLFSFLQKPKKPLAVFFINTKSL